jgi:transcriptional regulator with XRE-family HTH domain
MVLSKRVRELRYAKGWGPDDLAARAKISRTALYQIESGKTEMPHAATLRRIAQALGTTPETLLAEPEAESAPRLSAPPLAPQPSVALAERSQSPTERLAPMTSTSLLRDLELEHKFRVLLASPLREGLARIVEETYQLLPEAFRAEVEVRRQGPR